MVLVTFDDGVHTISEKVEFGIALALRLAAEVIDLSQWASILSSNVELNYLLVDVFDEALEVSVAGKVAELGWNGLCN